MSKRNDGGAAFPFIAWQSPNGMVGMSHDAGMSLRDWFAGQALSGLMSNEGQMSASVRKGQDVGVEIAAISYLMADAMLAAREKGGGA